MAAEAAASGALHADWPAPAHVRTAITLRTMAGLSRPPFDAFNLGGRCGDDPAVVEANRAGLFATLGLPAQPLWLRQVHGKAVVDADAMPQDAEPEADAAATHANGTVLAVLTADCLPVLLCAADGSAIAVAHAGWRGLAAGVIEATVAKLGVASESVLAWLGPAIGPASYEVGDEVRAAFLAHDESAAAAFEETRPGHWLCDLYALARQRLASVGVRQVFGGEFDTFADPRFYSYRRDRETGRFASLIWLS
jgi:purine-nucleoside/S-methyl-5'-thioadenosine phosphorylase / adenosine deaminase